MENKYFLEKILADSSDYWVVAKDNHYRDAFEDKRGKDDIMLISLPRVIQRPLVLMDLTLKKIEEIQRTEIVTNIYFSGNFSPFQIGVTLDSFYDGFPLPLGDKGIKPKEFVKRALELNSAELDDYKKILEDLLSNVGAVSQMLYYGTQEKNKS